MGTQLFYGLIDFKKVAIGTRSCQSNLNTQWVSLNRFIEHEHINDTLGYKQCVETFHFLCVIYLYVYLFNLEEYKLKSSRDDGLHLNCVCI